MREAFGTGEITYCKVRAISRVATPETEEQLVELARHATGAQLEKVVRYFGRALAVATGSSEKAYARRQLNYQWEDDGSLRLTVRLPPDEGALVLSALKVSEEAPDTSSDDSAEAPAPDDPLAARRADALVSMARAALADGEATGSDGEPCEVVVHVDVESLADQQVHDRCELEGGPVIAPETVRRLGCDGSVVRIIERDGRPLSVGRRKRTVPAPLRRALRSRDQGCRFPGCTHERFLHAHHIQHWARGGETTLDNLIQLCSYHHRLVHEGGFAVERTGKSEARFRRPDGRVIQSASTGQRACGPGLERQHRTRGLEIDDVTCKPRSLGDSLDYDIAVVGLCERALVGT